MKKKVTAPVRTDPSCYTYFDKKTDICWILQPAICDQGKNNTGLTENSLYHLRYCLNQWKDEGTKNFIIDDQRLGDYMLGENLTEFTEKSIAFAVKIRLNKDEKADFAYNPSAYLFNYKDDLADDVEVLGTISFSPCSNRGNYNIDYCVVNEKNRGKGLGSRMIKSFTENADFFTYGRRLDTVYTSVRSDNARCQQMLKKLGFALSPCYGRGYGDTSTHKVYRTYKKVLNEEMENY